MSLASELIEVALEKIGKPTSSKAVSRAVYPLHSMLSSWCMQGINIGIVLPELPGSELAEPAAARNAIIINLAMLLATSTDDIPEWFVNLANWEFNSLETFYRKKIDIPVLKRCSSL